MPLTRARISTVSTASVCPTYSSKTEIGSVPALSTYTSGGGGGGGAVLLPQPAINKRPSSPPYHLDRSENARTKFSLANFFNADSLVNPTEKRRYCDRVPAIRHPTPRRI